MFMFTPFGSQSPCWYASTGDYACSRVAKENSVKQIPSSRVSQMERFEASTVPKKTKQKTGKVPELCLDNSHSTYSFKCWNFADPSRSKTSDRTTINGIEIPNGQQPMWYMPSSRTVDPTNEKVVLTVTRKVQNGRATAGTTGVTATQTTNNVQIDQNYIEQIVKAKVHLIGSASSGALMIGSISIALFNNVKIPNNIQSFPVIDASGASIQVKGLRIVLQERRVDYYTNFRNSVHNNLSFIFPTPPNNQVSVLDTGTNTFDLKSDDASGYKTVALTDAFKQQYKQDKNLRWVCFYIEY